MTHHMFLKAAAVSAILVGGATLPVQAAFFHVASGSIDGSLCLGNDCVASESFGFDTLRLKENNLRIGFTDTSSTASFPSNDWRIVINASSNGGAEMFAIEDTTGGRTSFTIEAGAPNHALYVDNGGSKGRIGFGTSTPVTDLHVVSGNTPTLRLEQDGSSGFTPQTWDVAGNEANFFIRDATSGSTLPLRIFPGAPSNALTIEGTTGDIGLNTTSPEAALHVVNTVAGAAELLRLSNNGTVFSGYEDTSIAAGDNTGRIWNIQNVGGEFRVTTAPGGAAEVELALNADGDLTVSGDINSAGTTVVPDYVFAEGYQLMPLSEVEKFVVANRHLPKIPSADDIRARGGVNMTEMQMALLEKVEELTLYTLAQQKSIDALQARLEKLAD